MQTTVHTYGELVEAQHVHDAYLGNDCPKEVRPLVATGSYQQAAIGPSLHIIQLTPCRVLLATQAVTTATTPCTRMMLMTMNKGNDSDIANHNDSNNDHNDDVPCS